MTRGSFRFGDFTFDPAERQLTRNMDRLEVSSRYLDVLALLLSEPGKLVTKKRFMDEVWRGIPVTEFALTQCISTLRRQLGDDPAKPHFIETVPKHGYRFIGDAAWIAPSVEAPKIRRNFQWLRVLQITGLAGLGGALAGIGGGLIYGLGAPLQWTAQGIGGLSILLVMLALNISIGIVAGLGVGGGIGVSREMSKNRWLWSIAGGMLGGFAIGGIAKLFATTLFTLLSAQSPHDITGPFEGALLGSMVGFAYGTAHSMRFSIRRSVMLGGIAGGFAGLVVTLLGGHLLGGSLNLLVTAIPNARFNLGGIGAMLGETNFGPISEALTAIIEGGLFGACLVGMLCFRSKPSTV